MSTAPNSDIRIRAGTVLDRPFISATWRRSYAESHRSLSDAYLRIWGPLVDFLLLRSEVRVATAPDSPELILGWLAFQPAAHLVHYVYVRGSSRETAGLQQSGVATALLEGIEWGAWRVTHETGLSALILDRWAAESRATPQLAPILEPGVLA